MTTKQEVATLIKGFENGLILVGDHEEACDWLLTKRDAEVILEALRLLAEHQAWPVNTTIDPDQQAKNERAAKMLDALNVRATGQE